MLTDYVKIRKADGIGQGAGTEGLQEKSLKKQVEDEQEGRNGGSCRRQTKDSYHERLMLPRAPNRDQSVRGHWVTVRGMEPEGCEDKAIGLVRVGRVCSDAQSVLGCILSFGTCYTRMCPRGHLCPCPGPWWLEDTHCAGCGKPCSPVASFSAEPGVSDSGGHRLLLELLWKLPPSGEEENDLPLWLPALSHRTSVLSSIFLEGC